MDILVADDLEETRFILSNMLKRLGHKVVTATNGEDALAILESSDISFLISDWIMPKLSGVQLCDIIRKRDFGRYIYIILLTALSSKEQVVQGLESGADDYIIKPFIMHELNVRIKAGIRIVDLEHQLAEQNTNLRDMNLRLNETLHLIEDDLEFAASLQRDLLPKSATIFGEYKFDWLFLPCHFTAGDIFNFYKIDDTHILFYQLDVAGHGAASAMLSFSLSKFISGLFDTCHIAAKLMQSTPESFQEYLRHPANILDMLNHQFFKIDDAMQYFTICIGVIDMETNEIKICRAGHPLPILIKSDTPIKQLAQHGYPIGILHDIRFTEMSITLEQGAKLFIYSDGLIEALPGNNLIGKESVLITYLNENSNESSSRLLERLQDSIEAVGNLNSLKDDISVLTITRE